MLSILARTRAHLQAVGETYWQHSRYAASVGALMVAAGLACLIHAVVPAFFETTASRAVRRLSILIDDRSQAPSLLHPDEATPLPFLLPLSVGAALLPWLAGAETAIGLAISLLALAIPFAFLLAEAVLEPGEGPYSAAAG
jgi:gamma-F420-2:alpha-L-glutamate ligase